MYIGLALTLTSDFIHCIFYQISTLWELYKADTTKDKKLGSGQGFYKEVCYDLDIWLRKFIQGHWKPLICRQSSGKVCACLGQGEKYVVWTRIFC